MPQRLERRVRWYAHTLDNPRNRVERRRASLSRKASLRAWRQERRETRRLMWRVFVPSFLVLGIYTALVVGFDYFLAACAVITSPLSVLYVVGQVARVRRRQDRRRMRER